MFPRRRQGLFIKDKQEEQHTVWFSLYKYGHNTKQMIGNEKRDRDRENKREKELEIEKGNQKRIA